MGEQDDHIKDEFFDVSGLSNGMRTRAIRGGSLLFATSILGMVLSMAAQVVLARLLTPDDFGVVAMGMVLVNFVMLFKDFGLSVAIIREPTITHREVTQIWWLNTLLGVGIGAAVFAGAPSVGVFYDDARVSLVLRSLSLVFVLAPMSAHHLAILNRKMRFGDVAKIGAWASFIGIAVGVFAGWSSHSYWALVWAQIAIHTSTLALAWSSTRWFPGMPGRDWSIRRMVGFGGNVTGFNLINYLSAYAGNLLIGWQFGAGPLGLYDKANSLFMTPVRNIYKPVSGVMVPALSRLSGDDDRYRRAYSEALEKTSLIIMPAMAWLSVSADWVVAALLGEKWQACSPLLMMFAIVGLGNCLARPTGWLFMTQDRTSEMLRWGVLSGLVRMGGVALGLFWGVVGVAASFCLISFLFLIPGSVFLSGRKGPVSARNQIVAALFPAAIALSAASIGLAVRTIEIVPEGLPGLTWMAGIFAAVYGIGLGGTRHGRRLVIDGLAMAADLLGRQNSIIRARIQ